VLRCDATGLFERCKLSLGQHQAILGAPNAPYLPERNYRRANVLPIIEQIKALLDELASQRFPISLI
jgi:hypothetical protein